MKPRRTIVYYLTFIVIGSVYINTICSALMPNQQQLIDIDNQINEQEYIAADLRKKLIDAKKEMDSIPDKVSAQYQDALIRYNSILKNLNVIERNLQNLKTTKQAHST